MKSYNYRDMHRILTANGFKRIRIKGDHAIYKNNKGREVTLTVSHTNICVATRLLKEIGNV